MEFTSDFLAKDDNTTQSAKALFAERLAANTQAFGKSSLRVASSGLPDYKSWLAQKRAECMPNLTIVDHMKPPIQVTVSQAQPHLFDDADRQYISAKLDLSGYEKNPMLSTHPIRTYVSNEVKYIPKGGHDPFINGSAAPIPPLVNQSCIKAAAQMYAMARHAGRDPDQVNKLFRWMWNLPSDFTLEPYAPQVDPTVSKPWLRLKQAQNYEVCYMPAQQGMIKVTTGSEIGVHSGIKWDVDWEWVRTCARAIMTRVCFIENHRFNLEKLNGLELKFVVRYDNFLPQSMPKFSYVIPAESVKNPFNVPEQISSQLYAANKILMDQYSYSAELTRILPELKPISRPVISTLPSKMILLEEIGDLNTWIGPPPSFKFVEPLELTKTKLTRKPLTLRSLLTQYVTQRCMRNVRLVEILFEAKASLEIGDILKAKSLVVDFFDKNELNGLLNLYLKMHDSKLVAVHEVWDVFTGGKAPGKRIKAIDANSLLQHYMTVNMDLLTDAVMESLRELRRNMAAPNILLFLRYMGQPLNMLDTPDLIRARIRKLISTFYIANYRSKVKILAARLREEKDKLRKKSLTRDLVKRQSLLRFYAAHFSSDDVNAWEIKTKATIKTLAYKYVAKRKRLQRKMQDLEAEFEQRGMPGSYEYLASRYDEILSTDFLGGIQYAMEKIKQTDKDLDMLFMNRIDYNILYGEHQRSARRLRLLMNTATQQYLVGKPDPALYDLEEDKKDVVRGVVMEQNNDYIPYEQLAYRGKQPKIMLDRPKWLNRSKFVQTKMKKQKRKSRGRHHMKSDLVIANDPPDLSMKEVVPLETPTIPPKVLHVMMNPVEPIEVIEEKPPIIAPIIAPSGGMNLDDLFGDDLDDMYEDNTHKIMLSDFISAQYLPWTTRSFLSVYQQRHPDFVFIESAGFDFAELTALRADQQFNKQVMELADLEYGKAAKKEAVANIDLDEE